MTRNLLIPAACRSMRFNACALLALAALVLVACATHEDSLTSNAERAVRSQLKDPDSAQFGAVFIVPAAKHGSEQRMTVCGSVNARNSFGGYAGMDRFVVDGAVYDDTGSTSIFGVTFEGSTRSQSTSGRAQPNETDFELREWNALCVDPTHPATFTGISTD